MVTNQKIKNFTKKKDLRVRPKGLTKAKSLQAFQAQIMSSMESRIDSFITEHELDPDMKDELSNLVSGCLDDLYKHLYNQPVPQSQTATKAKKVLKSEKIEDPATCETLDDLRNCTTGVLNQFCKEHGLKVGGNKKEIMDRVWRHIQGNGSDEDKSTRNKPKAEKKVPEKHACSGTNVAGVPCGVSATEEFGGCHFCWRHITDAQKFIDAIASESVAKPKAKAPKAKEAKPKAEAKAEPAAKPARAKFVPKKPEPEPEIEPELEEEEELVEEDEDDEDQQETDNEN